MPDQRRVTVDSASSQSAADGIRAPLLQDLPVSVLSRRDGLSCDKNDSHL
jgi:hypothetical protein